VLKWLKIWTRLLLSVVFIFVKIFLFLQLNCMLVYISLGVDCVLRSHVADGAVAASSSTSSIRPLRQNITNAKVCHVVQA